MLFNSSKKYDFMPELSIKPGPNLELVESCKLLGVIIQSNLRWNEKTDFICKRAFDRMWMIRRLKLLGASTKELVDVYAKQVRSILEQAVPVWSPSLTISHVAQIERVQKTFCAVVLGPKYTDYSTALVDLDLSPLDERRESLCLNFAKKCLKNEK